MAAKKPCTLTVMSIIPFLSRGASSIAMLTFGKAVDSPQSSRALPFDVLGAQLLVPSRPGGTSPDSLAVTRGEVGVDRLEECIGESAVIEILRV